MAPEVFIGMLEGRDLLIHSVPINEGDKSEEIDPVLDGVVISRALSGIVAA